MRLGLGLGLSRSNRSGRGENAGGGGGWNAGFTPQSITSATVVGWWRSDLGITIGTGVSAWENQANVGGGTGWTQGTAGAQPVYSASDAVFNNRPSLLWDGVNDEMAAAIAAPAPGTTNRFYWIVAQNISFVGGSSTLISGVGGTAHIIFRGGADTNSQLSQYNGVQQVGPANFPIGGAARIVQSGYTNSPADFLKIGGSNVTGTSCLNNSAASMRLGSFGGAGFATVKIAEVLITNGIPSASDRAALEAYGVSLYGANVTA